MNGLYEVSNKGRVRSLRFWSNVHKKSYERIKIMKFGKNALGYCTVILTRNKIKTGKNVHRLVAEAFIDNPNNYNEVNHIDENPSNNCVENLEWCSHKYNINYGNRGRKISQYTLQGEFVKEWKSIIDAERELEYKKSHISQCCKGKIKTSHGYIWRYRDE